MSEETPMQHETSEPIAQLNAIEDTLDKFIATGDVQVVYGEPITHGDTVIIPSAEILVGLGFGLGYGSGKDDANDFSRGVAGGGGGRVLSRPVAIVIASPEGVRVEPVVDITKIGLAALTAAGFMFGMILRMTGVKRAKDE